MWRIAATLRVHDGGATGSLNDLNQQQGGITVALPIACACPRILSPEIMACREQRAGHTMQRACLQAYSGKAGTQQGWSAAGKHAVQVPMLLQSYGMRARVWGGGERPGCDRPLGIESALGGGRRQPWMDL